MKTKVVLMTRSLDIGGAERQLVALAKNLSHDIFEINVISFYAGGALQAELEASNIPVITLEKSGRWDLLKFPWQLLKTLQQIKPDILHGYLWLPNIMSVLLKPFLGNIKIIFGVRFSYVDLSKYDWTFRFVTWLEGLLSRFADLIIINSNAGVSFCKERGFPPDKIHVIPNGIDTNTYTKNENAGQQLRKEWGITDDDILIGIIGRLDPMKDHPNFIRAAGEVHHTFHNTRFICVGSGPQTYQQELQTLNNDIGVGNQMIWSETRQDMPAIYNALDICCSTSIGEGFSNVLGEAMSCGTPCIATDVGDSQLIIGDTGLIVPPKDSPALANAIKQITSKAPSERAILGSKARERIIQHFSLQKMIANTEKNMLTLVNKKVETN